MYIKVSQITQNSPIYLHLLELWHLMDFAGFGVRFTDILHRCFQESMCTPTISEFPPLNEDG